MESRVFLTGHPPALSLKSAAVLSVVLGIPEMEAKSYSDALSRSPIEQRSDVYFAMPRPHGHAVGVKSRAAGSKKEKFEVKFCRDPDSDQSQGCSRLDAWVKYKSHTAQNSEAAASWLASLPEPLAHWAADQFKAGTTAPVTMKKSRQVVAVRGCIVEETDMTYDMVSVGDAQRATPFRSWAIEGDDGEFIRSVAAGWEGRVAELDPKVAMIVDGYPGFVTRLAFAPSRM